MSKKKEFDINDKLNAENAFAVVVYEKDLDSKEDDEFEIKEGFFFQDLYFGMESAKELARGLSIDGRCRLHNVNRKCLSWSSAGEGSKEQYVVALVPPEIFFSKTHIKFDVDPQDLMDE